MEYNDDESITITKSGYLYLHEQAEYLSDLISIDKLKDYIVACGGKARDDVQTHSLFLITAECCSSMLLLAVCSLTGYVCVCMHL